jgi:16S rRNA processing protein RimM
VSSESDEAAQWVTIARLGKTRGNRGEITALPLSSKPERYQELKAVYLFGDGRRCEIESAWFHAGTLVLKFRGVDSISEAETLAGWEVRIPRDQRLQPDPDEYFCSDLVGCEVVDRRDGQPIGTVTAFEESAGAGLLVVGDDLLIPFARSICVEINPAERRIVVDLPEGLRDLNLS